MPLTPEHVAIVMDGNGRWAEQRNRPRNMGHQAGVRALRKVVEHAGRIGIGTLTVFAFSSENWQRPPSEVLRLMDLFMRSLESGSSANARHSARNCAAACPRRNG
jgi:undecaprenyl diphosphate synthase